MPQSCFNGKKYLAEYFSVIRYRLSHLRDTNIELGVMHLEQGRITDAALRFYMIDKWIAPGDKEAAYYRAWVYFLQCDVSRAMQFFQKAGDCHDARDITAFIQAIERGDICDIPFSAYCRFQDFTVVTIEPESHRMLVSQYLTELLLEYLDEVPEQCRFLEIGSNGGVVAQLIRSRISREMLQYEVVEPAPRCRKLLSLLEFQAQPMYDDIVEDVSQVQGQYDVIFSVYGLNHFASIVEQLQQWTKHLKPSAIIVLAHRITRAKTSSIDLQNLMLLLTQTELERDLKLANLQIEGINIEQIDNVECAFVICRYIG